MTSIDFYFNASNRLSVACRLAAKAHQQQKRVLIYAPHPEDAEQIDRLLWTAQAVSFVAHCRAEDPLAVHTPVLITESAAPEANCEVLLNLASEHPPLFERHERLLEIVSRDDADRQHGRTRYAYYRDRGYAIRSHDLGRS